MRSAELREVLRLHLEAVSLRLQSELARGVEVPFELEHHGRRAGRGSTLYCYRPLTREFIASRESELRELPTHRDALRALADMPGLEHYLLAMGIDLPPAAGAARLSAALAALTEDAFGEQTDFELREERVQTVLARLEGSLDADPAQVTLVASLLGMAISASEIALAPALRLARAGSMTGLPAGLASGSDAESGEQDSSEGLLVVLEQEHREPSLAIEQGRQALAELLRALRLFGDGRIALARVGWTRVGEGAWHPCALGSGGRPHGMLLVAAEQEDELRAFASLIARRTPSRGPIAWALRRFELGCERENALEGLSDHVLALKALLGSDEDLLTARLAALCATADGRAQLAGRVQHALELERDYRAGEAGDGADIGEQECAAEIAAHLRALLRDVVCGHLPADLVMLADELSLQASDPGCEAGEGPLAQTAATRENGADAVGSLEQILSDPSQSEEILNVLI